MGKFRADILAGDLEFDLAEWYLNECGLTLSDFFDNQKALTREAWEANQENIQYLLKMNHFRREAYLVYGYLTLRAGAALPAHLRAPILDAARWEHDKDRWQGDIERKFYLKDFREKVKNYRPGKPVHFVFLNYNTASLTDGVVGLDDFWKEVKSGKIHERTHLNLATCNLETLPAPIINLKNLKTLALEHNELTALPTAIQRMTNLRAIYLEGNRFSEFPSVLADLPSLEYVNLKENEITRLSSEVCKCERLRMLVLSRNPLKSLPACLSAHPALSKLFIEETSIDTIPKEFQHAPFTIFHQRPEVSLDDWGL